MQLTEYCFRKPYTYSTGYNFPVTLTPQGKERQEFMRALVIDNSLRVRQDLIDVVIDAFLEVEAMEANKRDAQKPTIQSRPDLFTVDTQTPPMNKKAIVVKMKSGSTNNQAATFIACVKPLYSIWPSIILRLSRAIGVLLNLMIALGSLRLSLWSHKIIRKIRNDS